MARVVQFGAYHSILCKSDDMTCPYLPALPIQPIEDGYRSLFRRSIFPKVYCSEKRFIVPKVYWSEGSFIRNRVSLLRKFIVPK